MSLGTDGGQLAIYFASEEINALQISIKVKLLGPVHFLLPDQQSGIHCPIILAIQLLTPNNLGGT